MYLIPVTQFLNDVPTSDVSKSVTSLNQFPVWPIFFPSVLAEIDRGWCWCSQNRIPGWPADADDLDAT